MTSKEIKKAQKYLTSALGVDRYFSHKASVDILNKVDNSLPKSSVDKLKVYINPFTLFPYIKLKKLITNYESLRLDYNEQFIEIELERRKHLLDNAAAFPLDDQQRRAVVADEDNSLVIAGAGSGKTMTIVAKVKYILEVLDASADTILPISFTRKSAEDMQKRINVKGVNPQTFHKFGLTVLQSVENRKPNIFDETNIDKLFRAFIEHLSKDPAYLTQLNTFFLNYIKIPKSQFEFETHGDYIQYLKDQNFTTYKRVKIPFQGRETYKNETVKSIEECIIANFLIFNRIDYEYEKQYEFPYAQFGRKKSYKPDFTINTPSGPVYLEHLGMDKNGNVPAFFAGPNESHFEATRRYQRLLQWKKRVHAQNSTKLIESYSYQFSDGTLVEELSASLINAGVKLDPMSQDEIWQVIQDSGKDQVDGFISLCQTFLALLKSNGHTVQDARTFNDESDDDDFLKVRATLFLDLFEPVFELYESNLQQNGEIDFNDMITKATEYIANGDYYCPLSYVIVDEFQDLSFGRYRILQAIRKQNPDVKFYCVGDDWQSIYRFAGSDITLFSDFEEHFGYTYTSRIETTYRFNDPLISLSSEFILKNPHQLPKSLRAPEGKSETTHSIIESESFDGDDTASIIEAINSMVKIGLTPDSEVYIIGRYNFDLQRIRNRNRELSISFSNGLIKYTFSNGKYKGKTLNMNFVTAHKAKGLEADFTILINCNSGKYGFPSGKADDPILNLLLSSSDQFENGEERRLFYVAMTRTKRHVTFVTDRYRKSKFIKELQDEKDERITKCPKCGNGELIKRSGKGYLFYGCSNFAYGCSYSTSKPPIDERQPEPIPKSITPAAEHAPQPPKSKPISKPSRNQSSKLNLSQQNKLEYFCKSPKLYKRSEKARAKVAYLQSISSKFNEDEHNRFEAALKIWQS
jgi:DNA helicase IV